MDKFVYCIKCEKTVINETGHPVRYGDDPDDWDWCFGELGFTSCTPPETDEAYIDWLMNNEPDAEWMELVNNES